MSSKWVALSAFAPFAVVAALVAATTELAGCSDVTKSTEAPPGASVTTPAENDEPASWSRRDGDAIVTAEVRPLQVRLTREGATIAHARGGTHALVWGLRTKLTMLEGRPLDRFGASVAVRAGTILVGALQSRAFNGDAVMFRRGEAGWVQEAHVTPPYPGAWLSGVSVALAGEEAFVGSAGPAFVYARIGPGWQLRQSLPTSQPLQAKPIIPAPIAHGSGTVGLLNRGIPADNGGIPASALLYESNGGVWDVAGTIEPGDPLITPNGGAIAIDAGRVAIGTGTSVLVYRRGQAGAYELESRLIGDESTFFGWSLALSGDTLLVGSVIERAVYVYMRASGEWTLKQKIAGLAQLPSPSSFGYALALVGDTAWVGDPDLGGGGAVFRYQRADGVWSLDEEIATPSTHAGKFGLAVAATTDTAVFGAPYEANEQGAIYVYDLAGALGDPCASATSCASGFCVEGVCCDTACGGGRPGSCSTCTGAKSGKCTVAPAGTTCRPASSSCDVTEVCDGVGAACPLDAVVATGTPCADGYCAAGACVPSGAAPAVDASPPTTDAPFIVGGSGCAISRGHASGGGVWLAALLAMAWLFRTRRRGLASVVLLACLSAVELTSSERDCRRDMSRAILAAHGLRARFFSDRTELSDLETGRVWSMAFAGFGRTGDIRAPALGEPEKIRQRVVRDARGVVEWYDAVESGIEHGFDVSARPEGAGTLVFRLHLTSTSPLEVSGGTLTFGALGPRVAYGRLEARDADGRVLPSEIAAVEGGIELRVDDANARYPLVVDPLVWRERQVLHASLDVPGAANTALFGRAIASSGDRAVIGRPSPAGAGSAHVFVRKGNDWIEEGTLSAPDEVVGSPFGVAVAIAGSRIAVGAPSYADVPQAPGAVYLYERIGSTWTFTAKLTAPEDLDGTSRNRFGAALSMDGDELAVGAPEGTPGPEGDARGKVLLFQRVDGTWSVGSKLEGGFPVPAPHFGTAIALRGDRLMVGAASDLNVAQPIQFPNTVWLFGRDEGAWSLEFIDGFPGETAFGSAVSVDGDVAVVGAPQAAHYLGLPNESGGAVHVYARASDGWHAAQKLTSPDARADDMFGASVSVRGDRLLVGALFGTDAKGAVSLFERNGGPWIAADGFPVRGARVDGYFGAAVDVSADMLLVGAPGVGTVTTIHRGFEGDACTTGASCASGSCVDGVCCSSACGGGDPTDCLACSVAAGAERDGTCGPARPRTCRPARGPCDVAESCDGVRTDCPPDVVSDNGRLCSGGSCSAGECLAAIPIPTSDAGSTSEPEPEPDAASLGCSIDRDPRSGLRAVVPVVVAGFGLLGAVVRRARRRIAP